jgi:TetR/AcrR family transcriptional regulator, mexJK operon transcriptional repressor
MPVKSSPKPLKHLPRKTTRGEEVSERLLQTATELFMEKGYEATSMTEIAAHAHASKETVYRRFPTKDDLFRAAVVRRAEMMSAALSPAISTTDAPEIALTRFGELVLHRLTTKDSIAFHRALGMARERLPEVLELYRTTGPFRVRDALARYLKQQSAEGSLRPIRPQVAARQFFDLFASEMIMSANLSGKGSPSKAAIKQRVKEAVECFLHGYAP